MLKKYLIVASVLFTSCFETVQDPDSLIGTKLPEFNLYVNDGKTVFNTKNIESGQPILIYFMSPDCAICKSELKEILNKIEQLKNTKIILVTPLSEQRFIAFTMEYELNKYPNIIPGIDKENYLVKNFHIEIVPYTATFNKEKNLTQIFPRKTEVGEVIAALNN